MSTLQYVLELCIIENIIFSQNFNPSSLSSPHLIGTPQGRRVNPAKNKHELPPTNKTRTHGFCKVAKSVLLFRHTSKSHLPSATRAPFTGLESWCATQS